MTFEDVSETVRYGLLNVLYFIGFENAYNQREIICRALRTRPEDDYWDRTTYDVEQEISRLLDGEPWFKILDAFEYIGEMIDPDKVATYHERMNALFADEGLGYKFISGQIVRVGSEEFHDAVSGVLMALDGERFSEPRRQFENAYACRNRNPPDWANAIKDAVNSVEGVLQIMYDRPGATLTAIVSGDLEDGVPGSIKRLFKDLYSLRSATRGAAHAATGGPAATAARAELAIHLAAALILFIRDELCGSEVVPWNGFTPYTSDDLDQVMDVNDLPF